MGLPWTPVRLSSRVSPPPPTVLALRARRLDWTDGAVSTTSQLDHMRQGDRRPPGKKTARDGPWQVSPAMASKPCAVIPRPSYKPCSVLRRCSTSRRCRTGSVVSTLLLHGRSCSVLINYSTFSLTPNGRHLLATFAVPCSLPCLGSTRSRLSPLPSDANLALVLRSSRRSLLSCFLFRVTRVSRPP